MIIYCKASDFGKFRSMYKKSVDWYLDLRRGLQYSCIEHPGIILIAILNEYYGYRCTECYVECEIIKIRW